jgi:hypothetical protein
MMEHLAKYYVAHPDPYDNMMDHFDEVLGLGDQKEENQVVKKKVRKELDDILAESDTEDEKGNRKGEKGKGKKNGKEGSGSQAEEKEEAEKEEATVKKLQLDASLDTQSSKERGVAGPQRKSQEIQTLESNYTM